MASETGGSPGDYLAAEEAGWNRIAGLVAALTPEEAIVPGYTPVGGWSVKDLLAHFAGWLAVAGQVLRQAESGVVAEANLDVDAQNAVYVDANRDQPMEVVISETKATRHRLALLLHGQTEIPPGARSALEKAGPHHYEEHLPRLEEWVAELQTRRRT